MLKGLTSTFKEGCNNVELTYSEYVKLDNQTIPVKATLKDDSYENGNFIGTFILKEIQFETEATYDFKEKEFEYYKVVNGESIKIGTFISTDITINDTTEIVKVVGMDYGLKTQIEYTSALDYASGEITLKDVWDECCELSGLESGIDDFVNSDFIVDSDQFSGTGAMIRDVFKGIAMSCGSFVKVMNDDKIYLVFNKFTSEKEELEIDGSASVSNVLEIDSVNEIEGNTTQEGTPTPDSPQPINVVSGRQEVDIASKNLFDKDSGFRLGYINGSGTFVSANNTACFNQYIQCQPNTTYTISFNSNVYALASPLYYDNNKTFLTRENVINNVSGRTFTTPANCYYMVIQFNYDNSSTMTQEIIDSVNCQVEKGSTVSEYEEFKGQSYEVNLGKNLYYMNYNDATNSNWNGVDITSTHTGYSINGTATSNGAFTLVGRYITLEAGTYTMVLKNPSSMITGLSKTTYNSVVKISIGNTSESFTLTEETKVCLTLQIANGTQYNETNEIMLEKGSSASSFSPYKTPIEVCSIGDYKDRIYKENGTWYLHKEIGKVVLNGSENNWIIINKTNGNLFRNKNIINCIDGRNTIAAYCDYFKGAKGQKVFNGNVLNTIGTAESNYLQVYVSSSYSSVSDWTTWLSTHNTIVYYVLATPTTTEITDSELISQLNSIELLEGLNNISITSNDLTGKLKLTYYNNEFDIIEDYVELEDKRDTHPWTCLRLGMSNIEGENVDYIDEDLVEQYGENWLILNDNPFAYNQEKRQQLIMNIFNQIKAFGYSAFVSKVAFKPYLTSGDIIHFRNRENELVKSIVLRYTHSGEQITLEAPSETSATVNYIYPLGAIEIAKQTQIIVDKEQVQIDSLTSQTQIIQDDLIQNYYTSTQTNELIQTAQTGLTNTFSEAGGNNIFRNTGLWFTATTTEQSLLPSTSLYPNEDLFMSAKVSYEFWDGIVKKAKEEKASNMSAMLLQNGYVSQEQLVPNGNYTVSFKYNKPIALSIAKVFINDVEYELTGTTDTEFVQVIEVSSQHIKLNFYCDRDNGCEIYDLMVNAGEVKLAYSQNQNETTTDTVNISKGITITSSDTDVKFKADSDGIRTLDTYNNVLTEFTDEGMKTKTATIESKSTIVDTLWQEVGNQTWITKL